MAAEQRAGRACGCGCGQLIESGRKNATMRIDCRSRRDLEKRAERHQRKRPSRYTTERMRKKPHADAHRVVHRVTWRDDPMQNRRQVLCKVCFGMPWARSPERFNDGPAGNDVPAAGADRRCRGCGEAWAPEPPPEPCEVITSSAGMVARHADLHSINFNTDWKESSKKKGPSRYGR